jgi:purine-binding chemotaxis protein CheW
MLRLFVWRVGSQDFAMPVSGVMQVVRAVAVTHAPNAPPFGCGEINVRGKIVPVFDWRKCFRMPERVLDPADHFIIVVTPQRTLALWVDVAHGVIEYQGGAAIDGQSTASGVGLTADAVELQGSLLLVHDLERCLSAEHGYVLDGVSIEAGR